MEQQQQNKKAKDQIQKLLGVTGPVQDFMQTGPLAARDVFVIYKMRRDSDEHNGQFDSILNGLERDLRRNVRIITFTYGGTEHTAVTDIGIQHVIGTLTLDA